MVPPKMLRSIGVLRVAKYGRALSASELKNSKAEPRNSLVPDLVISVMAAPPAMPCSASKLLVLMFTVSMVSAGATYIAWCGSQRLTLVAPSDLVLLLFGFWPFT